MIATSRIANRFSQWVYSTLRDTYAQNKRNSSPDRIRSDFHGSQTEAGQKQPRPRAFAFPGEPLRWAKGAGHLIGWIGLPRYPEVVEDIDPAASMAQSNEGGRYDSRTWDSINLRRKRRKEK